MKRKLIIAAVVLVLVIVGIGVYLYNSMDSIVKAAVEKYGSEIMGTKVSVASVDISLKSGRGTIRGVEVHNPKGYSSARAFRLSEITLDLDVASMNKDPIVIDEVKIAAPEVNVELKCGGQSNIAVIKEHVDAYGGRAAAGSSRKQDSGYEKRFRITKFTFEDGKVAVDAQAVGAGQLDTSLPAVNMSNVGGEDGATPDGIGKDVTRAFLGAVMGAVSHELGQKALNAGENAAEKALHKILK